MSKRVVDDLTLHMRLEDRWYSTDELQEALGISKQSISNSLVEGMDMYFKAKPVTDKNGEWLYKCRDVSGITKKILRTKWTLTDLGESENEELHAVPISLDRCG